MMGMKKENDTARQWMLMTIISLGGIMMMFNSTFRNADMKDMRNKVDRNYELIRANRRIQISIAEKLGIPVEAIPGDFDHD